MKLARRILRIAPEPRLALWLAVAGGLWLLPGRAGIVAGGAALAGIAALVARDWLRLPGRDHLVVRR